MFITNLRDEEHFISCQLVRLNTREKVELNKTYLNYNKRIHHLIQHPLPSILQQVERFAYNLEYFFIVRRY